MQSAVGKAGHDARTTIFVYGVLWSFGEYPTIYY